MTKPRYLSACYNPLIQAIFLIGLSVMDKAYAREIHVCPQDRNDCQSIYALDWPSVQADDTIIIHGGAYHQPIVVHNVANGANIIPDNNPVYIDSTVAFVNAKYVRWNGEHRIHIRNTEHPGIAITRGSSNLVVANTEISHTGLGIWIAQEAGCGHNIFGNTIVNNRTHGIAIDKVNCTLENKTKIFSNSVKENSYHGIEINGNYYEITANEVAWNGGGIAGTNGIHVYAADPAEGTGQHIAMEYNYIHDNVDTNLGLDGNGIKLDRFTRFNYIGWNAITNNDGSGIMVFDSSDASIVHNLLYGNVAKQEAPDVNYPGCCLRRGQIALNGAQALDPGNGESVSYTNEVVMGLNRIRDNGDPIYVAPFIDRTTIRYLCNWSNYPIEGQSNINCNFVWDRYRSPYSLYGSGPNW